MKFSIWVFTATPILQAEIGIATQQLKETGAIKITQIGEDPNMQRLQDVLTNQNDRYVFCSIW